MCRRPSRNDTNLRKMCVCIRDATANAIIGSPNMLDKGPIAETEDGNSSRFCSSVVSCRRKYLVYFNSSCVVVYKFKYNVKER